MFTRPRSVTVSEAQIQSSALLFGNLSQLERTALSKSWKRHLFVLGKLDGGAGLALYVYSNVTSPRASVGDKKDAKSRQPASPDSSSTMFKLRNIIELEEGCEARPLSSEEIHKEHCFMVVTAKGQIKFQAESEADRARWLECLSREFEKAMEGTMDKQKSHLLKKGLIVTWHRPRARGGPVEALVRYGMDDSHTLTLFVGDGARIPFSGVDEVIAGNDCELLKSKFHFNCFMVKLTPTAAQTSTGLWEGCVILEFEAQKQSTRDDLVSALEVQLKSGREVVTLPPMSPMMAAAATNVSSPTATPHASSSAPSSSSATRLQSAGSVASRIEDSDSDDDGPATTTSGAGASPAAATGVGEYFKQKVKLGRGFPYARCISLALYESLQGDRATSILTPHRDITQGEATEVLHYTKLALPPTPAEIQAASETKKGKQPKPIHFEMSEHAPSAFRELRNRFGVTDAQYLKSLSQLSGDGAVGDGKSGMLFFFTADRRYVLKTVKPNEMAVLVEHAMLPAYLKHMEANPDTLVCRFFGLYRYKMGPKGNARDIFLVCMQNSFDTKLVLHEKYDLKGSTRNRWCTPRFGSVLKDLNFGNSKLYMDESERAELLHQCEKDTQLFEAFNVMDYSLLLGIHKPADEPEKVRKNLLLLGMAAQLEDKPVTTPGAKSGGGGGGPLASGRPKPTRWQRDFGGVESFVPEAERRPQVYIMCIIDILQAYDLGKKAENLIKSQMNEEKKEISAVNPKTYRQRFLGYLARIIVGVPGQNAVILATRNQIKLQLHNLRMLSANDGLPRNARALTQGSLAAAAAATTTSGGGGAAALPSLGEDETVEEEEGGKPFKFDRSVSVMFDKNGASKVSEEVVQEIKSPAKPATMEDEIQAAILEAEQEKLAQGGDLYTEVLEDGTEIIIMPEGGFIQRNPDGTEIRSFPDGTSKQTNPDGSVIMCDENGTVVSEQLADGTKVRKGKDVNVINTQENPDGSILETYKDGSTIQKNKDGSRIEINQDGDQKTIFPDGVIIEATRGGLRRQLNPNGVEITTLADGTRIQINRKTDPNLVLTIKPDGTRIQEDRVNGTSIFVSADGKKEEHRLADGTVVIKDLVTNYTKQINVNGSLVETFKDGSQKVTPATGG